jgi:RNA recognition motif-containing protein
VVSALASGSFDRIFVGRYPKHTTELDLRDALAVAGFAVREVELVLDRVTGLPRGFAFILLESRVDADAAEVSLSRLRAATVDGQPLEVQAIAARTWWHVSRATSWRVGEARPDRRPSRAEGPPGLSQDERCVTPRGLH